MDYLPYIFAFVATLIGLVGDRRVTDSSGKRRITNYGRLALCIALLAFSTSVYLQYQKHSSMVAKKEIAENEILRSLSSIESAFLLSNQDHMLFGLNKAIENLKPRLLILGKTLSSLNSTYGDQLDPIVVQDVISIQRVISEEVDQIEYESTAKGYVKFIDETINKVRERIGSDHSAIFGNVEFHKYVLDFKNPEPFL